MALYEITGTPDGTEPQTMETDDMHEAIAAIRAINSAQRAANHPKTIEARAAYKALPLKERAKHKFAKPSAS